MTTLRGSPKKASAARLNSTMRLSSSIDDDDAARQFHERAVTVFARAQSELGPEPGRDVDRDAADERAPPGPCSITNFSVVHQCVVPSIAQAGDGGLERLARLEHLSIAGLESGGGVGRPQLAIGLADHVLERLAELRGPGLVAVDVAAIDGLHERHGRREPHERSEARLGRAMLSLRAGPFLHERRRG